MVQDASLIRNSLMALRTTRQPATRELKTVCTFKRCVIGASLVSSCPRQHRSVVPDLFRKNGRDQKKP
ncbi:MAG TPA: hypothetical protein VK567_07950, partial [Bradyrhizobium sp.]|nr:hypothetical protein [Bradyrhizobium sp.]